MSLHLHELRKHYGATRAVDGVTLELDERETLALLGPSGCGKSTLLRLVAGLEAPDAGHLSLDGSDITQLPPQRRRFGMVFQDYALFPHLDVGQNVAFGLVELRWERAAQRERVGELLELVGLAGLERRRVQQLSGGQQQRVALARALAPRPEVLLLDEPLSNLDQTLREALKDELSGLLSSLPVRAVYVTHDQSEAFTIARRVAVMKSGRLAQVGTREEVLEHPRTGWLAHFLGHRNVFEAADLARVPGAPQRGPALLRSDLTRVLPAADGGGGTDAVVRGVARDGLRWKLRLALPDWGIELAWEGYDRELPGAPTEGQQLRLHVPAEAWQELDGA